MTKTEELMQEMTRRTMVRRNGLTFVQTRGAYSIYTNSVGDPVYLAHGSPFTPYKVDFDEIDLPALWQNLGPQSDWLGIVTAGGMSREEFVAFLRATLTEPDIADEIRWCTDCSKVTTANDGHLVMGGDFVCAACVNHSYSTCQRCLYIVNEYSSVNGDAICEACLDAAYSYCDYCDHYYPDDYSGDHQHGDGCCESPAQEFVIRNDGLAPLANDVQVHVTLPAGVIDEMGMQRIINYLYDSNLRYEGLMVPDIGDQWQTKEGNFTKRLSRAVYKRYKRKMSTDVLSMIGTIAGEHSRAVDFTVMVTRDLNQHAGFFYHTASCWWGGYSEGRCALKTNGGFGLLTYSETGKVSGRAWVLPLKDTLEQRLHATFNALTPDGFMVFNGYGTLSGYNGARIIAHMAGMTYRKVGFEASPMFINNDAGYLVAPEDIAARHTNGYVNVPIDTHSTLFEAEQRAAVIDLTEKELASNVA